MIINITNSEAEELEKNMLFLTHNEEISVEDNSQQNIDFDGRLKVLKEIKDYRKDFELLMYMALSSMTMHTDVVINVI